MVAVKLQKLGDEYHLARDAEAVATLGACEGDLLSVDCAKSTHVKAASDQIALGLALMERYRGAFERLAK